MCFMMVRADFNSIFVKKKLMFHFLFYEFQLKRFFFHFPSLYFLKSETFLRNTLKHITPSKQKMKRGSY